MARKRRVNLDSYANSQKGQEQARLTDFKTAKELHDRKHDPQPAQPPLEHKTIQGEAGPATGAQGSPAGGGEHPPVAPAPAPLPASAPAPSPVPITAGPTTATPSPAASPAPPPKEPDLPPLPAGDMQNVVARSSHPPAVKEIDWTGWDCIKGTPSVGAKTLAIFRTKFGTANYLATLTPKEVAREFNDGALEDHRDLIVTVWNKARAAHPVAQVVKIPPVSVRDFCIEVGWFKVEEEKPKKKGASK